MARGNPERRRLRRPRRWPSAAAAVLLAGLAGPTPLSAQQPGHAWYVLQTNRTSASYADKRSVVTTKEGMKLVLVAQVYAEPQPSPSGAFTDILTFILIDCAKAMARGAAVWPGYVDAAAPHPALTLPGWEPLTEPQDVKLKRLACGEEPWGPVILDGTTQDLRKGYLGMLAQGLVK